jgi:hypothetical protein
MNFNGKRFCGFSRTGESVRFPIRQPPIPAFGQACQETQEWAGNPGFSRIRFGLWTPALPNLRWKLPKVSGLIREYPRINSVNPSLGVQVGGQLGEHRANINSLKARRV